MSDVAGAAPPAPTSVPIDTGAARIPNPVETSNIAPKGDEVTTGQPPSAKERRSIDDIIKTSHEKVTKEAEAKEKAAPKAKEEPAKADTGKPVEAKKAPDRGEGGRFASARPQEAAPAAQQRQAEPGTSQHHEAPTRFSADAKAEWATAPESVRAETHRAVRELEGGIHKYRADAEAFNEIREFDSLAKKHGTTVKQAMANYVNLDSALLSPDPARKVEALNHIFQRAGINPREWAARLLDQAPDQRDAEQHQTVTALRGEIANLKKMVGGVVSTVQHQQATTITADVTSFAKANPRFDELSAGHLEHNIQNLLKSGLVPQNLPPQERLQKAYELAERLNPSAHVTASLTPEHLPANGAGTRSIAGSPANGSDPSIPAKKKGERTSIDDAIKRAAARLAS